MAHLHLWEVFSYKGMNIQNNKAVPNIFREDKLSETL